MNEKRYLVSNQLSEGKNFSCSLVNGDKSVLKDVTVMNTTFVMPNQRIELCASLQEYR